MHDPAVAAAIAAGRVPDNVSEALLNESRDGGAVAAIILVSSLTFIVVCCRAISRKFLLKRFGYDDGLAVFSLVIFLAFVVQCCILIKIGAGRREEYLRYVWTEQTLILDLYLDYTAHITYIIALLVCRLSGLAFYSRLCLRIPGYLLMIKIVAGMLVAAFLLQLSLLIFHCHPITALWPFPWQAIAKDYKCLQWVQIYSVITAMSLFSDLLLFGIPITMLRSLDLPKKRKTQLACILLPGICVTAISVARIPLVVYSNAGMLYDCQLAVEVSEVGTSLIALSVPGIKPMFDRWVRKKSPEASATSWHKVGGSAIRTRGSALCSTQHGTAASSGDIRNPADYELQAVPKDADSIASTEGILVRMDISVQEEDGPLRV